MAVDGSLEPSVQDRALTKAAKSLDAFQTRLGYKFANTDLLTLALTHLSAVARAKSRVDSYERLEFLGDRVLGLTMAEAIYAAFPDATEGELARRFADLVRRESCAEVGAEWGVGAVAQLGAGEEQSGGREKPAILADLCESVIGAVFLDGGYEAARNLVTRAWAERIRTPRGPLRDPKTSLQEWAQARRLPPPAYSQGARSGPDHAPHFVMVVSVAGFEPAEATGPSKRLAEQAAADAFINREGCRLAESAA